MTLAEIVDGVEVMHVSLPMITGFVLTIVTGVIGAVGALFVRTQRREREMRDSMRIQGPVPEVPVHVAGGHVEVSTREKYLTREEFLEYKGEIKTDVSRMLSLYDKAITLINERDSRLSEKLDNLGTQIYGRINDVVAESSERRRNIFDKLEEQGKSIASIDSRTDVSKAIGQLGKAIIANSKILR